MRDRRLIGWTITRSKRNRGVAREGHPPLSGNDGGFEVEVHLVVPERVQVTLLVAKAMLDEAVDVQKRSAAPAREAVVYVTRYLGLTAREVAEAASVSYQRISQLAGKELAGRARR